MLALAARRGPRRSARTAARQHLGLWALLALVLTGALLGPWAYAGLWAGDGGLSWVQAGGAPTRGTVELVESAVPAELSTPGIASVTLLPALWLVGLAALAQVTWPRETGPRRRAALRSRSWRHLLSQRVLVILGGATDLAAAGIAAMAGLPAVDGVQLRVHTGPESTPFRASADGRRARAGTGRRRAAAEPGGPVGPGRDRRRRRHGGGARPGHAGRGRLRGRPRSDGADRGRAHLRPAPCRGADPAGRARRRSRRDRGRQRVRGPR